MSTKLVQQRPLGSQGLIVSQQGIGCMGMTAFYGSFDRKAHEEESLKTIATALKMGVTLFDTAWVYQSFGADGKENSTNEEIVGKAIAIHGREKFIIATKFGIAFDQQGTRIISGSEATIRSQLNDSLTRLGTSYIDLYYQHRMDPDTPIEETMRVLKSLVEEGKIKYIGLSECTPSELRRAHAIHPISAIQMEWSLQSRSIEEQVVPTARELGVGIVAYSPLGRGLLSGTITSVDQLDEKDFRRTNPRFKDENFAANVPKASFADLAAKKGCTPAQLALAWLHAQGDDVFPIPGTKTSTRLVENASASFIKLTPDEIAEIEVAVPRGVGDRYYGECSHHSFVVLAVFYHCCFHHDRQWRHIRESPLMI